MGSVAPSTKSSRVLVKKQIPEPYPETGSKAPLCAPRPPPRRLGAWGPRLPSPVQRERGASLCGSDDSATCLFSPAWSGLVTSYSLFPPPGKRSKAFYSGVCSSRSLSFQTKTSTLPHILINRRVKRVPTCKREFVHADNCQITQSLILCWSSPKSPGNSRKTWGHFNLYTF